MIYDDKLQNQLQTCLGECGYEITESRGKNAAFEVLLDHAEIGYMDQPGRYHLMEDCLGEREKLNNILQFANDFRFYSPNEYGLHQIMEYGGMQFSASLDPETGKAEFLINSQFHDETHPSQREFFTDFEEAKYAFVKSSRLYDPNFAHARQEQVSAEKFMELARKAGYKFAEIAHPVKQWTFTNEHGQKAGYITKSNDVVSSTNLKSVDQNVKSLYAQAKWEIGKEQNGQSYFLQKVTDALRQLGYTIKHAWQRFSVAADIYDAQNPIGTIEPNGQVQVHMTATPKQSTEIDEVVKRIKEEIRTEFQQYQKTMTRTETQTQGAEQSVQSAPQEEKPAFTNQEMLFVKALLCSAACKDLVAKNVGMNDIAASLSRKIKDNYPSLPDYSKKDNALAIVPNAGRPAEESTELEN